MDDDEAFSALKAKVQTPTYENRWVEWTTAFRRWARARAATLDQPAAAKVLLTVSVVIACPAIVHAYRFDHFTHQWQNTAVIGAAALIALAGARRALAAATLRPTARPIVLTAISSVALGVIAAAAVWQADKSFTVPTYTEANPATYRDPIYLYLEGESGGAVARIEVQSVDELEFSNNAARRTQRDPLGHCWDVRTTISFVAAAETWPWEGRQNSPSLVHSAATVEVMELDGEWTEASDFYEDPHLCLSDFGHGSAKKKPSALGTQRLGSIVVVTDEYPPIALRITDSAGVTSVINLQDPGTECARYEGRPYKSEVPVEERPCHSIHDLYDQEMLHYFDLYDPNDEA